MISVHANTAAVGQLQIVAWEAISEGARRSATSTFYAETYQALQQDVELCRHVIVALLQQTSTIGQHLVRTDDVALVHSTTDGLATAVELISGTLPAGSRAAISKRYFASARLALTPLEEQGVKIVEVGSDEGQLAPAALADVPRLGMVVVDWVNHISGVRNEIGPLAEYCTNHSIPLVVDAVQGVGAIPLDFDIRYVDVLACGGHKWLRGPEGTGFLYLNRRFLEGRRQSRYGYRSLENPATFDVSFDQLRLADRARRIETGTLNTLGFVGLRAAIRQLLDYGPDAAFRKIHEIVSAVMAVLGKKAVQIVTPKGSDKHAGIVSFRCDYRPSVALAEQLGSKGVVVGVRRGLVRISPSYDCDVDFLCSVLSTTI